MLFRYHPDRHICLDKPMGAKEGNVMVCICLGQGVALLEVWSYWRRCFTMGLDFNTIALAAWKGGICKQPSDEDGELSGLLHHACPGSTMLPP